MITSASLPEGLPQFQTRQALLVLDLQNDFISLNAQLPVSTPDDFISNIKRLVPTFREAGDVIWVRSEFQEARLINDESLESETVITDNELPKEAPPRADDKSETGLSPGQGRGQPQAYSSASRTFELYKRIAERNLIEDDDESETLSLAPTLEEENETFLSVSLSGKAPTCCQPGSYGADFADLGSPVMNTQTDAIVVKSHYSAFNSTALLSSLRSNLVTELFICGIITNVSVYATALDAARHGFSITIIEDAVGYREKARHDEALRQMKEYMGAETMKTDEMLENFHSAANEEAGGRGRPTETVGTVMDRAELEKIMEGLTLRAEPSIAPSTDPVSLPRVKSDADSGICLSHASEFSSTPAIIRTSTEAKPKEPRSVPKAETPRPEKVSQKAKQQQNILPHKETSKEQRRRRPTAERQKTSEMLDEVSATLASTSVTDEPVESPDQFLQLMSSMAWRKNSAGGSPRAPRQPRIARLRRSHDKIGFSSKPGPKDFIGEGDSQIIPDLLPSPFKDSIFDRVREEVRWKTMHHRGGEVPRLVAVQGNIADNGSYPIYRHPADESPPLLPFSPVVCAIRDEVQKVIHHPVNHVLIQWYRDGHDYISEHSDKTLDIVRGSSIVNVSLGAQRTMILRTKKQARAEAAASEAKSKSGTAKAGVDSPARNGDRTSQDQASSAFSRRTQRIAMPHNSMFVLGQNTNMRWLHGIRQDKRPINEKKDAELAYGGERISLTFRHIGTFVDRDSKLIWGQGATFKRKNSAGQVMNGDSPESREMIKAFGQENQQSEFDWDDVYGRGFNVVDFVTDTPQLFLSGHEMTDLRVKLHLSVAGVTWSTGRLSDAKSPEKDSYKASIQSRFKFVDNDPDRTEVVGPLPVLTYVDNFYRFNGNFGGAHSRGEFAKIMSRFGQSNDVMRAWERVTSERSSINSGDGHLSMELLMWEDYAAASQFIASGDHSIADSGFWPVLRDIIAKWTAWDEHMYPALWSYHLRMLQRPAVKRLLLGEA
ncbi:MAG: hypothetical protein M1825_006172 [Sarcosagium campestre]|nr:MAG: hypothetical protein M1825_006172 [Sarcosagium campestre]